MNPLKRGNAGETRAVEQQKCAAACAGCRTRKIRCNGGLPCPNCADRSLDCYYPEAQRRGPRTSKNANKPDSDLASDSSSRSKSARTSSNSTANPRANNSAAAIRGSAASSNEGQKQVAEGACFGSFISYMEPGAPQPTATIDYQPMAVSISDSTTQSDLDPRDSTKLTDCDTSATPDGADDLAGGGVGCEYHGPGAMISICSKSAVTWVCEKTNGRDFQKISARFASDISRRLKLDRGLLGDIEPEPPKQLAWAYCNAFFNGQSRIWFKMIHQATFEARLTSHLTDDNPKGRDDPSWYALRNVVYAIGCRTLDSKQSSHDLQEASQKSRRYFCNALSMHTELLYSRTGLFSVQALALMSAFAEGITCPSLDFMLCSDALRLAESKGLHRGSTACLKRETDVHTAGHLWWAIYTHHVMIISRSGRSLQIDDDTITCPLPAQTSGESWGQHAAATGMVKHAQILSSVIRSLNAIRSSRSMSDETFALVQRSDRRLHEWRNSLPRFIQFGMLPGAGLPKGVTSEHCLLLEYSYYTTLIQIHSIVMAPWSKVYQEKPTANPSHQAQIFKSASIVAEASRKIISQLRYISVSPDTPKWAVLVYPMIALIHLFIFILEYPASASVDADISLMHEAAAHFNFLEYRTGSISLPFARDLANLVRVAVARQGDHCSTVDTNVEENPTGLEAIVERPQDEVFGLDVWDTTDWDAFIPWDNVFQDFENGF